MRKKPAGNGGMDLQRPTDNHKVPTAIDADILGDMDDALTVAEDGDQPANYFEQIYASSSRSKKSAASRPIT